jgi:hypothetical protein
MFRADLSYNKKMFLKDPSAPDWWPRGLPEMNKGSLMVMVLPSCEQATSESPVGRSGSRQPERDFSLKKSRSSREGVPARQKIASGQPSLKYGALSGEVQDAWSFGAS